MKAERLDGAPPGSMAACQKAGWIQKKIITQLFKYFVRFVKACKEQHAFVTLDGHSSHTRNIEVTPNCARQGRVHTVCLPLTALQPLGVSSMQPLNTYYAQEMEIWLNTRPNRI
jgi:hypothetical protein